MPIAVSSHKFFFGTLFLSFVIHVLAVRSTTILFPILKESFNPNMTFHGSFLKSSDTQGKNAEAKIPLSSINLPWKEFEIATPIASGANKPFQTKFPSMAPKITEKSFFPIETMFPAPPDATEDLGIDLEIKTYEPLRFQTK